MSNKLSHIVFTLIIFMSVSACTPTHPPTPDPNVVVIPTSDNTPPTVGIIVNDSKTNLDVNETSKPKVFRTGADTVSVIAGATDDNGGIKAVNLWATYTYYTSSKTSSSSPTGTLVKQDVSNAQVGEFTLKNRFFSYNFDMKKELGSWLKIKIDVWMEGENFYGGKVSTPVVSIWYPLSPLTFNRVCNQTGGPPVSTMNDEQIAISQNPGRKKIVYQLPNDTDILLIILDDAPGLTKDQMQVELDLNPVNGVEGNKAIEAWGACHQGSRVNMIEASMIGGLNVGTACKPVSDGTDFRSDCTNTQTMLLNRNTTSELWLRKPELLGIWTDVQVMDSSIWPAFGGRSVRFIWNRDSSYTIATPGITPTSP